ncbi:hypothetical protein BGX23_000701, partial [Mortierella sp. AD031]
EEQNQSYGVQDTTVEVLSTPEIIRPRWTWDWELPWLEELKLSVEFAYRFEFRMLHGCPALKLLSLDMDTTNGQHSRILSADDLVASNANNNDPSTPPEEIVAPTLRYVYLTGRWLIEDAILPAFLNGMFPNLAHFHDIGCEGFTLGAVLDMVRAETNRITNLSLDLQEPSRAECDRMGV